MALWVTVNTKGGSKASDDHLTRAALGGSLDSDGPGDLHSGVWDVSSLCFLRLSGTQLPQSQDSSLRLPLLLLLLLVGTGPLGCSLESVISEVY